jgi:hypothetical protein
LPNRNLADQCHRVRAAHDTVDERVRRERREALVEARDEDALDPERGEALELRAQRGQARRRRFAGEELAGMRVERQHRGGQAEIVRGFHEPGEHRLMPAMDAVEIADGSAIGRSADAGRPRWTRT